MDAERHADIAARGSQPLVVQRGDGGGGLHTLLGTLNRMGMLRARSGESEMRWRAWIAQVVGDTEVERRVVRVLALPQHRRQRPGCAASFFVCPRLHAPLLSERTRRCFVCPRSTTTLAPRIAIAQTRTRAHGRGHGQVRRPRGRVTGGRCACVLPRVHPPSPCASTFYAMQPPPILCAFRLTIPVYPPNPQPQPPKQLAEPRN